MFTDKHNQLVIVWNLSPVSISLSVTFQWHPLSLLGSQRLLSEEMLDILGG